MIQILILLAGILFMPLTEPDPKEILAKMDANMLSHSRIVTAEMIIYGKRKDRVIESKSYSRGDSDSFTEYLSPAREKGTKMLKLEDQLWIFSPQSERTIKISGHLLKQSVMGSDLSYEDMMENRSLLELYAVEIIGSEIVDERTCWIMELTAKVEDVTYAKRKMWVDQERFVALKEELYAKSGTLLKKTTMREVKKIEGRWFPTKMNYKDMLNEGKGTDFVIKEIQFDPEIPEYMFTKSVLRN